MTDDFALIKRILRGTTGNVELRRGVPNSTGKYDFTGRIFTRDLKTIDEHVNGGTGDVFHGVNTRRPGAASGKKEDVCEVTCIPGDVDFKTTPPEKFEETLVEFPLKPTVIVDSGNGRHPYWFLRTPIVLNGDAKQVDLIEGIGRGLGKMFGGDHVYDISRVLRTPGRPNSKYAHKPLCRIIFADGPEYDLEDLLPYAEQGASLSGGKINLGEIPSELPEKFKELLAKHHVIRATWRGERPDLNDQSGSGYDMAIAAILARFGFSAEEIGCVLRQMPSGKGRDATTAYLERTIGKAFATINQDEEDRAGADRSSVTAFTSSQPHPQQAWPKLEEEAYYGLLGDIVKAIEPHTEADPVAVLANVLCAFGGVVGRAPHFCVEATKHFTNEFFVIVGETSKARKGQSWSTARKMFNSVDPEWVITAGLSSGEGLGYAVRDQVVKKKARRQGGQTVYEDVVEDEGVADKRLLIVEQEFSQALKVMSREGNILSPTLRQAWDGDDLHPLTKNNPIRATEPHISIIAHITTEELLRHLTEIEMGNGFGNRFIWLLAKRSKEIPNPTGVPSHLLTPLILKLGAAVQFARTVGTIERDAVAEKLWGDIYPKLSASQPGLTGSMLARSEAHVMRLASIYALANLSKTVGTEHLKAALCLWDYSDESVRLIFGVRTGDPLGDRIYRLVKEAGGSVGKWDTINALGRNYSKERIDTALDTLERARLLKLEEAGQDGRGRPKVIFKALR